MTRLVNRSSRTRPRVAVLCTTAWGARNLVLSGLLAQLQEGLDVTVLSGLRIDNAMAEPLPGLVVEPIVLVGRPSHDPGRVLLDASFARRHHLPSYDTFARWFQRDDRLVRRAWHRVVGAVAMLGARQPLFGWQQRADIGRALRRALASDIPDQLRTLAPDLLVSTAPVVTDEAAYALVAAHLGIETLGCILSFDNLTSRGRQVTFGNYCVWSEAMRMELLRLYPGQDERRIHVTGTPQFDLYRQQGFRRSRGDQLMDLGLPPGSRYILHAANSATFTPSEPALVRALRQRMDASPALRGHHLVVRPHPADDLARWEELASGVARLRLSRPRPEADRFASRDAQRRLVSTVVHADACVTMASTMALDAAVANTPVVCVGFALERGSPEDRLARDCHRTSHFEPVIASGGVRLAGSLDALVSEVSLYVRDRSRDAPARRRLVEQVCGPVDGNAAARIATVIGDLTGTRLSHTVRAAAPPASRELVAP